MLIFIGNNFWYFCDIIFIFRINTITIAARLIDEEKLWRHLQDYMKVF